MDEKIWASGPCCQFLGDETRWDRHGNVGFLFDGKKLVIAVDGEWIPGWPHEPEVRFCPFCGSSVWQSGGVLYTSPRP